MLPLWKCCQRPIASFNDGGGKLDIGCWLLDIGYLYIRLIVFVVFVIERFRHI